NFEGNIYEVTNAVIRRARQITEIGDDDLALHHGKVVSTSLTQIFTKKIEYQLEEQSRVAVTPLVVIFGPPRVGTTAYLSQLLRGFEIVAADSIQVCRRLDIGSAKPSAEERARVPHHLIDIRDPSEPFDVGDFVREASRAAADIASRGRVPVLSGGA